ncbi:peptidoglycan DD-metalloendopeptidase family protein [Alteromonas gracilis]|uniref:peptidoglycan DD-metalloendopeptidase family protein n=1 Tax=Alteromonas gracilis TaxID=1479524 RepID=UPI003734F4CD
MHKYSLYLGFFLFICLLVSGCAGRTAPAPVILLNSQVSEGNEEYTDKTYQVQRGDTLYAVAWYTGKDYRDLAKYNNLSAPYVIFPGQVLHVSPPTSIASTHKKPKAQTDRSTPLTRSKVDKSLVDRKKTQAYVKSEKVVNPQNVTTVKKPSKSVKKPTQKGFPDKVKKWVWPAEGNVVDTFSKSESGNKGIDIAGARGNKVVAAADGKVVYSGNALRGYGNLVIIKHTDTFLSAYAYNDRILVKEREWVSAGQQIATMGDSGTNSVKLHFEVRYRGKSLDPMKYLPTLR